MSSPRVPSPDPQALGTTDQRTVLDFHRQDDLNASRQAHHHDLGSGFNQGSPGSHNHDGSDSVLIPDLEAQKLVTYPYSIRMTSFGNSLPSAGVNNYAPYGGTYDATYGYNSSAADIVATRLVLPYSGIWLFNLWVTWILYAGGESSSVLAFDDVPMASEIDSISIVNISGGHYYRQQLNHSGYHPKNQKVLASYWQSTGQNAGYSHALTATLLNRIGG